MTILGRVPSPFSPQAYGIQRTLRPAPSPTSLDADETLPLFTRRPESKSVLPMRCLSCHGPVLKSTAPVTIAQDGYRLTWDSVPAWVCSLCGFSYFELRKSNASAARSKRCASSTEGAFTP